MKNKGRVKKITFYDKVLNVVHDFAYLETIILLFLFFLLGYMINPKDICMIDGEVSYILILFAVITLFHGFGNGMFGISILAFMMWYFYETFAYIEFLVILLMTMIFSEFHFYWNKKIKKAKVEADYKTTKLNELSRSFYSLKISHDQLEKNYVVKPMSIRNSIEYILDNNKKIDPNEEDKQKKYYMNFIELLGKSFNVSSALVIYKKDISPNKRLADDNASIVYQNERSVSQEEINEIFKDSLVYRAIDKQIPIFVSDENGLPDASTNQDSDFIATFPVSQEGAVVAILVIRRMPFMAFNREILTSIAILLDYFAMEQRNANFLKEHDGLAIVKDRDFRYEYARLHHIYQEYEVDSFIIVFRIDNELQAKRVYERIIKMLRSLDKAVIVKENELFYIVLMFPLNDRSVALGFHNRLFNTLEEEKDKKFNFMTFSMKDNTLLNKYLREDYAS